MQAMLIEDFITKAITTYENMLFRIALQRTGNKADSEDIVQEVFIALLNQPPFNNQDHLRKWLVKTCINKCNNLLVSSQKTKNCSLDYDIPDFDKQDYDLLDALEKLSIKDRDLLYLFYFEGYSAKEIAEIFDKKENAIFIQLSRAREKLKKLLEVD